SLMNYVVNYGQLVCYKNRPSSRATDITKAGPITWVGHNACRRVAIPTPWRFGTAAMVGDVVGCGYSAEITVVADPCLAKVLHLHHCLVRICLLRMRTTRCALSRISKR